MLVYFALGDANFLRRPCTFHFLCVDFFALGSKRKPNSQWNIGGVGPSGVGAGVGHVHFMFFVLISFAFCSQRKPSFQWNMGFMFLLVKIWLLSFPVPLLLILWTLTFVDNAVLGLICGHKGS